MQIKRVLGIVLWGAALSVAGLVQGQAVGGANGVSMVGKPQGRLAIGEAAPEIGAVTVDGEPTGLAAIRGATSGKIMVLQFGSITDPIFRAHADAVEKLAGKLADKAVFVLVYQKEAHPADKEGKVDVNVADGFNLNDPVNLEEREKLARQAVTRLGLKNEKVVVDVWNNTSALRYGSYPNMTFVIDAKGNLQAGYPYMDTKKVQAAVEALVAGKDLTADLRGSTMRVTGPEAFDASAAAMDMTGGRGPATIAAVLDRVTMTDAQRAIVMPAVADFLADLQEFRQARQALPAAARGGAARGPARGAAPVPPVARGAAVGGAGGAGGDEAKVSTPAEVDSALGLLKASAQRLEAAVKQNLNAKDATQLLTAMANMAPAQRLFSGVN